MNLRKFVEHIIHFDMMIILISLIILIFDGVIFKTNDNLLILSIFICTIIFFCVYGPAKKRNIIAKNISCKLVKNSEEKVKSKHILFLIIIANLVSCLLLGIQYLVYNLLY